ncbi:septum site-determining protein MinC [Psychromonas sp. MME1]|uniref:septum site-determining protein MinC n=2 Tax=unclassified Psychromonas TaxID=2614957 RepID=UPI0034E1A2C9
MALKSLNFTLLVVDIDSEDLSVFSDVLIKKRAMAPDFFNGAPIVIKVDNEAISIDFAQLQAIVHEQAFILVGVTGELSVSQKEQLKAAKIAILSSSKHSPRRDKVEKEVESDIESSGEVVVEPSAFIPPSIKTTIYSGRVRSGQQIYAKESDLVINGDVGAGAEVIADGSVHIYGALRGKALAGAMGNKSAAIFCQILSPELVSIAGVYKLSDDLDTHFVGGNCMVSLQDEQIVLNKLTQI